MKKLSLRNLKLGNDDLLQREQLKTVFGGNTGCAYQGGNGYAGISDPNMAYMTAMAGSIQNGGYFCCASCCGVSWLSTSHKQYLGC